MGKKGWIDTKRTMGNYRLYNVDKYIRNFDFKNLEIVKRRNLPLYNQIISNKNLVVQNVTTNTLPRLNINYVRVSSIAQKPDLDRQEKEVMAKYPNNLLIKEVGSGINMNRRGLKQIIDYAIKGQINTVVVAYKDRMARFGFELIEHIIHTYSNGKIIILNKNDSLQPEEQLTRDVLAILNVFVAKMNGMRKYKKRGKQTTDAKIDSVKIITDVLDNDVSDII